VRTDFIRNIMAEKFVPMIEKHLESIVGFPVPVELSTDPNGEAKAIPEEVPPEALDESEYIFSNFVVGTSNKFAHAASLAVAANPGKAYNPLFIYGPSGLGKTHLLYAICNEVAKASPEDSKVIIVKGEEFTNELIYAIQTSTTKRFHDKYRSADVLLVDDIQFIAGKESTQEEFFHTFNTLYQDNKQIVMTSDRPPKEIKTLEDRLRTRFEWGLLADIQVPDFETRTAIIKRKAEMIDFQVPTEVAEYIANRLKKNIRQLEGTVKKLKAHCQIDNVPPSIMLAQNSIRDILNDSQPVPVTVERIISEVARTYSVMPMDLRSNKRSATISRARQTAMYVVREITQLSLTSIGEEFGGRDHSTVVYAMNQVEARIEKDYYYKETIEDIIKNIRDN
jgi:chromosomal replication initiator protein